MFRQGQWAPSIKYSYNSWDILHQMTPAENYRHQLATSGKTIRMLQRLEWRWQKALQRWWILATRVQSGYRGMVARKYYRSIKNDLIRFKEQREAQRAVVQLFSSGEKDESLIVLDKVEVLSTELWIIKIKILFSKGDFLNCAATCRRVIEINGKCEEAYYTLACIMAREERYEEAYMQLKLLMSYVDEPNGESFRLNALICMKLVPPKLSEAVISANSLVAYFPEDMSGILQRACILACSQDWDLALKDLNVILLYQPNLTNVRCLRARTYTAVREWDKAKGDYEEVLKKYPQDPTAWYGLADIEQPYDPEPSVDFDLVADAH